MLDPDALRLTAALVHTVPSVTAVLTLDHGRPVVVGADRRCLPDLSPCQLRRLVADRGRGAPELTWLTAVASVELGGPEVTAVDEGVVRLGDRPTPVLVFATLLGPGAAREEMAAAGRTLRDDGAHAPDVLAALRASTFHDELLGATTVVVAEPPGARAAARDAVRAAARATRVAELLESVAAAP